MSTASIDLHVVLVEPEIHWNTGNAGRSCLAAGAQLHLVEPLGFSLEDREVRRSGLDYWHRVEPRVWPDWPTALGELGGLGALVFFTPEAERTLWDVDLRQPSVLVFGRESRGLPTDTRRRFADHCVRIPFDARAVRSVNLSTCVGIALFEALRQRRETAGRPGP